MASFAGLQDTTFLPAETIAKLLWYGARLREEVFRVKGGRRPNLVYNIAWRLMIRRDWLAHRADTLCRRLRARRGEKKPTACRSACKAFQSQITLRHREPLLLRGFGSRGLGPHDQPEAQKRLPKPSKCVKGKWGETIGISNLRPL